MVRPTRALIRATALACVAFSSGPVIGRAVPQVTQPARPSSPSIDVVVLDRNGQPIDDIRGDELMVTVDGRPRPVASMRYVARGPGAAAAASLHSARLPRVAAASEPDRTVLLAIDQNMIERGDEAAALRAANAFLDRLGLSDRVAIARLPAPSGTELTLTTDRPAAREALRAVMGRAASASQPDSVRPAAPQKPAVDPDQVKVTDPDSVTMAEREQPVAPAAAGELSIEDQAKVRDSVDGIRSLLAGLVPAPGRKVILLFSAGLPRGWNMVVSDEQLRQVALAASTARTVVHTIGLRSTRLGDEQVPELTALETLARMTGGAAATIDRQPTRTADRLMPSLSSCYTLVLEANESDADGRRHALKVETTRKGASVRAPAWLATGEDPADTVVSLAAAEGREAAPAPRNDPTERDASNAPRDAELAIILSRLFDYVTGYQQAFSAVVAEESYTQSAAGKRMRLRSDFLLVRPAGSDAWVSFRDVYEVDGVRVRDRDERLKRLFLENPGRDTLAQLAAIKAESARYNIGPVDRNVNVPLFALRVLAAENRGRFRFTLARTGNIDGVPTKRIDYLERQRPTLVSDTRDGSDVPLSGWVAVDPLTGAIAETLLEAQGAGLTGRYVVRYRRDEGLGLWVPAEMQETYMPSGSRPMVMDALARYSNFRRFQIKTEEKIAIPK